MGHIDRFLIKARETTTYTHIMNHPSGQNRRKSSL